MPDEKCLASAGKILVRTAVVDRAGTDGFLPCAITPLPEAR